MTASEQAGKGSSPRFINWFLGSGTLILVLFLAAVFCGTNLDKRPHDRLERYTPITKNLSKTATLTMYEGLPSDFEEEKLYAQEVATKKIVRIHKHAFYETPLTVSPEDVEKLRLLLTANYTFGIHSRTKCYFHPDYALEWKDEGTAYEVLICLTCRMARFSTSDQEREVDVGIQMDEYDKFTAILNKYVNERPPKEKKRR